MKNTTSKSGQQKQSRKAQSRGVVRLEPAERPQTDKAVPPKPKLLKAADGGIPCLSARRGLFVPGASGLWLSRLSVRYVCHISFHLWNQTVTQSYAIIYRGFARIGVLFDKLAPSSTLSPIRMVKVSSAAVRSSSSTFSMVRKADPWWFPELLGVHLPRS